MLDPNNEYDVIIVGAGPAGLASAKSCVEHGLKILVLEEHPAIGVPVQCGEAFYRSALAALGLGNECVVNEPRGARLYSPGKKVLEIALKENVSSPIVVVERKMLEKKLAVKVTNMGAKIFVRTRVLAPIMENGLVKGVKALHDGKELELRAKLVIACDGPSSKLGQLAGLNIYKDPKKFGSCIQFQLANIDIDEKTGEIYFSSFAPRGYIWVIPKSQGFANVGIGVDGRIGYRAQEYLLEFIKKDKRLSGGSVIESNGGIVPMGGAVENFVANGLILVGDAARQVNPLTGGGTVFAVKAGIAAGAVAAEAVQKKDFSARFLAKYEKIWRTKIGNRFKAFGSIKEILYHLSDKEIDDFFENVGKIQIPQTDDPWYVFLKMLVKLVLKEPKLALKFGKALPYFI